MHSSPKQKGADLKGCNHDKWGQLQDTHKKKKKKKKAGCGVCHALHSRSLEIHNSHYNQELLCEVCGFSNDVRGNDDSAEKLSKDEDGAVYSLLEYSLRSTQHMTVLSRFVESEVSTWY
jgi:hypothetical protein